MAKAKVKKTVEVTLKLTEDEAKFLSALLGIGMAGDGELWDLGAGIWQALSAAGFKNSFSEGAINRERSTVSIYFNKNAKVVDSIMCLPETHFNC